MKALFPSFARLAATIAGGLLVASAPSVFAQPRSGPAMLNGRWTVDEERPVYTARGRVYQTVDIAPCGRSLCGVSVNANDTCGASLFRLAMPPSQTEYWLRGHALWGQSKKKLLLLAGPLAARPSQTYLQITLGDGYNFGERSGNMPTFRGEYRRLGEARCTTR